MTVDISIILITVREDYSIIGLPQTHILDPCIESLKKQSFKNFEFIVVDALYPFRKDLFKGQPFNLEKLFFRVKHVPVHYNHNFWFKQRRPCSCEQFNTGIINVEGELIVKLDDCCQFSETYLTKIWELYHNGYFPLAMHIRYLNGEPAFYNETYRQKAIEHYKQLYRGNEYAVLDRFKQLYGENGLVRDTRWKQVEVNKGQMVAYRNWYYGYSSLTLDAALKVNGMDELMDADYSLMDVDLGQRLTMAIHENLFYLSKDLWVIEHSHIGHSNRVIDPNCGVIKCNYAILKLNENKRRWRSNSNKLDNNDLNFVKQETLRQPCSWTPHQYLDNCEGSMFNFWANNQPIFDLRKEREENIQT